MHRRPLHRRPIRILDQIGERRIRVLFLAGLGVLAASVCILLIWLSRSHNKRLEAEISSLRSQLTQAERRLESLEQGQVAATEKYRRTVQAASESVGSVVIKWTDTDGSVQLLPLATGFRVRGCPYIVTAGHVVNELQRKLDRFKKMDLKAVPIVQFANEHVSHITAWKIHPAYDSQKSQRPQLDLGVLSIDQWPPGVGLPVVATDIVGDVGEEVLVAGFPTALEDVDYLSQVDVRSDPMVRVGRIERLLDCRDSTKRGAMNLIQCNIPAPGGFSGSPIVNLRGEVIGVVTFANHRTVMEVAQEAHTPRPTPILDAAHIGYGVSIKELLAWVGDGRLQK